MNLRKCWFEALLAMAASFGVIGIVVWLNASLIKMWWSTNWWWVVGLIALVTSRWWWEPVREIGVQPWRGFTAFVDYVQDWKDRNEHRLMLVDTRGRIKAGHDIEYSNQLTGISFKASNPLLKASAVKVQEVPNPQLEGPKEVIPAVIAYSSIASQVPADRSLLGVYPETGNLEIVDPERYKTAWFVGGSNTGKTNTVYGKVADAVRWGARMIICDSHAYKKDSLANKLSDFHHTLLMPIAQTDEQIKNAIIAFLREFKARRDHGKSCADKWLIVADEVNATANHMVRISKEEAASLLEEFGIRIEDEYVKLQVFFKFLAETCGYEARGFEMFGYFISQKVAGLAWLRNAMMTVFVHGLLMDSEALLAANSSRKYAELIKSFKAGRTLVYGLDFDPVVLQQPKYEMGQIVDSTIVAPTSNGSSMVFQQPTRDDFGRSTEGALEAVGRYTEDKIDPSSFELKKLIAEIGKMKSNGLSNDAILKQYGLNPGGRNNQNLKAVTEVISELEAEEA